MRFTIITLVTFLLLAGEAVGETPVTSPTIKNKAAQKQLSKIVKRLKDPYKELSKEDWEKLNKGKVMIRDYIYTTPEKKQAGMAKGIILADLPPDDIWDVITDYEHYNEFLPSVKKTKILKKYSDGGVDLLHIIKIFIVKLKYVCRLTPVKYSDGSRLLQWKLIKYPKIKNDLKATVGFWEVIPVEKGKKTILTYTAFVDTGWAVPGWVQRFLTKTQLPKVLKGAVKEAEKRYKK